MSSLQPPRLGPDQIADLLGPYLADYLNAPPDLYIQLARYLDLLLKWNNRTNLTAIREPEEIVRRHFGESLFAARHLDPPDPAARQTLLDFGSGAGFPGLPIQLLRPEIVVTLAESQNKKASFLREVVRTLGLKTEVYAARVEEMPPARVFDTVALRAVDNMASAIEAASRRAARRIVILASEQQDLPQVPSFEPGLHLRLPGGAGLRLIFLDRTTLGLDTAL